MDDMMGVDCLICGKMVGFDEINAHEASCTGAAVEPTSAFVDTVVKGGWSPEDVDEDVPHTGAFVPTCSPPTVSKQVSFGPTEVSQPKEFNVDSNEPKPKQVSFGVTTGVPVESHPVPKTGSFPSFTEYPESYTTRNAHKNAPQARTCYTGLNNQGATCYLNSLIQTLFMCTDFRREILQWDIPAEMHTDVNVPYQLQLLFSRMRFSEKPAVETKGLTKSFRWTSSEHFQQHDVQELNRVLFEALQKYLHHWQTPDFIRSLFEGTLGDYIQCSVCKNMRERVDTFQDVNIAIKGEMDLHSALRSFTAEERLGDGNAVFCEVCQQNQDSLKGLHFKALPPIFTMQLQRFGFDFETLRREKLYTNIRIPQVADLSYLHPHPKRFPLSDSRTLSCLAFALKHHALHGATHKNVPPEILKHVHSFMEHCTYELLSVLAHRGTAGGGHYIAYVKDLDGVQTKVFSGKRSETGDIAPQWYTFNDEMVSPTDRVDLMECIDPSYWQEHYDDVKPPEGRPPPECVEVTTTENAVLADIIPQGVHLFSDAKCIITEQVNLPNCDIVLAPGDVLSKVNGRSIHYPCDMVDAAEEVTILAERELSVEVFRGYAVSLLTRIRLMQRVDAIKARNGVKTCIPGGPPIPPPPPPPPAFTAKAGSSLPPPPTAVAAPPKKPEGYFYLSTMASVPDANCITFGDPEALGAYTGEDTLPEGEHRGLYVAKSNLFLFKETDFVTHVGGVPVKSEEEWRDLVANGSVQSIWLRRKHKTESESNDDNNDNDNDNASSTDTKGKDGIVFFPDALGDEKEGPKAAATVTAPPSSPTRSPALQYDNAVLGVRQDDDDDEEVHFDIFEPDPVSSAACAGFRDFGPPTEAAAAASAPPQHTRPLKIDTDLSRREYYSPRLPPTSCRMYPYMAVYRLRGFGESDFSSLQGKVLEERTTQAEESLLPAYMRDIVRVERDAFGEVCRAYTAVEHLVEMQVFYGLAERVGGVGSRPAPLDSSRYEWVTLHGKDDSAWLATLRCAEAVGVIDAGSVTTTTVDGVAVHTHEYYTPQTLRLRHYVSSSAVPGRSVQVEENGAPLSLSAAGVRPCACVVVERIEPGSAESNFAQIEFAPIWDEDIRINLSVYNRARSNPLIEEETADMVSRCLAFPRSGLRSVVLRAGAPLGDVCARISAVVGIPASELVVTDNGRMLYPVPAGDDAALQAPFKGTASTDNTLLCESLDDALGEDEVKVLQRYYADRVTARNGVNEAILEGTVWITVVQAVAGEGNAEETEAVPGPVQCFVAVPVHCTASTLHSKVADIMCREPASFQLRSCTAGLLRGSRRVSDFANTALRMCNNHETDTPQVSGNTVFFTEEESSPEGCIFIDVKVKDTLLAKPRLLLTVVESVSNNVSDFKDTLAKMDAVRETLGITCAEDLRLTREDPTRRMKAILSGTWTQNCTNNPVRVAVVAARRTEGETSKMHAVFLTVQQAFREGEGAARLSEVREVAVGQPTVAELQKCIKASFSLDCDAACVHFISTPQGVVPADITHNDFADFDNPFGMNGLWKSTIPRAKPTKCFFDRPYRILHGTHVLFHVNPYLLEEAASAAALRPAIQCNTSAEPARKKGSPPSLAGPWRSLGTPKGEGAKKSASREAGIVIRTEWDTTPPEVVLDPVVVDPSAVDNNVDPETAAAIEAAYEADEAGSGGCGSDEAEVGDYYQYELVDEVTHCASRFEWDMDCLRRNEKQGNDVGRCSICLCDYDFGDAVAELTCGSNLHQACLAQSIEKTEKCPVCMTHIPASLQS